MPKKTKTAEIKSTPVEVPVIAPGMPVIKPEEEAAVTAPVIVPAATPSDSTDAKPADVVKEGALASAIADLAQVVDPKPTPTAVESPVVTVAQENSVNEMPVDPAEPKTKKSGGGLMWVVLAFLTGLGAGMILGYLLWGKGVTFLSSVKPMEEQANLTQTTASPSATPNPSPTAGVAKIDKSTLKIQVLNGTGGKGVAAIARDYLLTKGYKSIDVGNADAEDFKTTEVAVKKGRTDLTAILKTDLEGKYTVSAAAKDLSASSVYDAVITIGVK